MGINKISKITNFIVFIGIALLFSSCNEDSQIVEPEAPLSETVEMAYPELKGGINEGFYEGKKVMYEEVNGDYVYEGDILLDKKFVTDNYVELIYNKGDKIDQTRSVGRTSRRWPNNKVYFLINRNLPKKYRVHDAISHWEAKTNLKFVKRKNQKNYIYFTPGSGCSSFVGMTGGRQNINLAPGCTTGSTIHEIGHAIGLWHEQSRVDRDDYITVNYDNVKNGYDHNFKTYFERGLDGKEYSSMLDFNSIMLYSSYAFSKNGKPTITKKDGSTYKTKRNRLSKADVAGVNIMYSVIDKNASYKNGYWYYISAVNVYRQHNLWWYYSYSTRRWRQVVHSDGSWYWV